MSEVNKTKLNQENQDSKTKQII